LHRRMSRDSKPLLGSAVEMPGFLAVWSIRRKRE
jgi:hypothetical protein